MKGIATTLEGKVTILLVEWPIKKDATNVLYFLEKMPNQKTLRFNGKYTGFIYNDVRIEVPDDEEPEEIQLGETLMTADINEDEGVYIRMDLENDKENKSDTA